MGGYKKWTEEDNIKRRARLLSPEAKSKAAARARAWAAKQRELRKLERREVPLSLSRSDERFFRFRSLGEAIWSRLDLCSRIHGAPVSNVLAGILCDFVVSPERLTNEPRPIRKADSAFDRERVCDVSLPLVMHQQLRTIISASGLRECTALRRIVEREFALVDGLGWSAANYDDERPQDKARRLRIEAGRKVRSDFGARRASYGRSVA